MESQQTHGTPLIESAGQSAAPKGLHADSAESAPAPFGLSTSSIQVRKEPFLILEYLFGGNVVFG